MGGVIQLPATAKSLVEFSASNSGALALTDRLDTSGTDLTKTQDRSQFEFMVKYQHYWFAVNASQDGTVAVLRVHGIIGHLPFTFQSSFARTNVLAVVKEASRVIHGKIRVDEKQRILLIREVRRDGTLTPKLILSETTKVLLQLKPYLELVTTLNPPKDLFKPVFKPQPAAAPQTATPTPVEPEEPVEIQAPGSETIDPPVVKRQPWGSGKKTAQTTTAPEPEEETQIDLPKVERTSWGKVAFDKKRAEAQKTIKHRLVPKKKIHVKVTPPKPKPTVTLKVKTLSPKKVTPSKPTPPQTRWGKGPSLKK